MDLSAVRVMVIDDQSTMRSIIRGYLKQVSITNIIEASDGNEAFKILGKEQIAGKMPSLIICDLYMEGMDGLDFLKKLRSGTVIEKSKVPVLILTGESDDMLKEVCMQVGAAKVLHKPISAEDLGFEIKSIVYK